MQVTGYASSTHAVRRNKETKCFILSWFVNVKSPHDKVIGIDFKNHAMTYFLLFLDKPRLAFNVHVISILMLQAKSYFEIHSNKFLAGMYQFKISYICKERRAF